MASAQDMGNWVARAHARLSVAWPCDNIALGLSGTPWSHALYETCVWNRRVKTLTKC